MLRLTVAEIGSWRENAIWAATEARAAWALWQGRRDQIKARRLAGDYSRDSEREALRVEAPRVAWGVVMLRLTAAKPQRVRAHARVRRKRTARYASRGASGGLAVGLWRTSQSRGGQQERPRWLCY